MFDERSDFKCGFIGGFSQTIKGLSIMKTSQIDLSTRIVVTDLAEDQLLELGYEISSLINDKLIRLLQEKGLII